AVGGDWYDVIQLPDGRVGVAIGDVVGHGLDAAMLMGGLRNALHAYALEGLSPADVAPRLARFAESFGPNKMATYIYGVFEPDSDTLSYVNGSHPQPLLVRPDGSIEYLASPLLPPLGVPGVVIAEESTVSLEPGSTLLLYTDGLIERRGIRLAGQQEELLMAAQHAPFDPDLLCDTVVTTLLGDERASDDVALLAVQRVATADRPLRLTVATRAEELAAIRRLLRRWLADAGADQAAVQAVLLASGEACSNAMEHAYGPGEQTFDVVAEHEDGEVVLTVTDRGNWRPPRGENRGRGLHLIETFMDDVEVVPAEGGTTIRMRKRITR
ncbi:MAG: SpoIIE family protein phosphatase, partial [Thermoleophilaceae bacterium]